MIFLYNGLVGNAILDDDDHGLVHLVGDDLADAESFGKSFFLQFISSLPP